MERSGIGGLRRTGTELRTTLPRIGLVRFGADRKDRSRQRSTCPSGIGEATRSFDSRTGGMGAFGWGKQRFKRAAVKQLLTKRCDAHGRRVTRFFREARLAAQLSHPNIVETYDLRRDRRRILHRHGVCRGIDANLYSADERTEPQLGSSPAAYIAASLCRAPRLCTSPKPPMPMETGFDSFTAMRHPQRASFHGRTR